MLAAAVLLAGFLFFFVALEFQMEHRRWHGSASLSLWMRIAPPLGLLVSACAALYLRRLVGRHFAFFRDDGVFRCRRCRYELAANMHICPECGASLQETNAVVCGDPGRLQVQQRFYTFAATLLILAAGLLAVW